MAARSLSNLLRDDTQILESMGEGFNEVEKNASLRHVETIDHLDRLNARYEEMKASNKELVESIRESNRKLIESVTKKEREQHVLEIEKRQLFSGTTASDNNVANLVDDRSVLTSDTTEAQRQLQKVKQKERELDAKKKRMDAQHEEKERSLGLREKRLDERADKKADKKIRDAKKQYDEKMRGLQSKNDQMKRRKSKSLKY